MTEGAPEQREGGAGEAPTATALSAAEYRSVFEAIDEGFCIVEILFDLDRRPVDYRFIEVNHAFEQQTGLHDARGKTILELAPDIEPHWIETYGRVATTGEPIRFVAESSAADQPRWFDEYAFPLGAPGSALVAIHFSDISERKHGDDELRYRSEQLHTLIDRAPVGAILLDADLRVLEMNPAARHAFSTITAPVGRSYPELLRVLWPQSIADALVEIFRHTLETGRSYHDPEMAEVRADRGVTEYYDWRIHRILLPDGRHGLVCYFSDISEQVRSRNAVAASEERYRTLFESIDEGFCIVDVIVGDDDEPRDYRFLEVNPAFERHTGMANTVGRTVQELVPDIEPFWIETLGAVALSGEPKRFVDQSATIGRWFDVYALRIGEPDERKVALLFTDISERKRAEFALQESVLLLRHHTHHDALTGLPNRGLFEERLRLAMTAAATLGRSLALLFIDLDGFKPINDSLGHAHGDTVLKEVARRLKRSLRASDLVARIHGDEFIAMLPELTDPLDAALLAQKLIHEIAKPITVAGTNVEVTASIGVSLYPRDATDPQALIRSADAAMYRAKLSGKNAVGYPAGEATDRAELSGKNAVGYPAGETTDRAEPSDPNAAG